MAYLLHIETTTTVCSVALSNDKELLSIKEINNGYTHAENLHIFIEQVLLDAKLKPIDLCAISISSGPGSYTGLRIGFSAAKGLAYTLKIPLITIDTLKILSIAVLKTVNDNAILVPMMDARRMEVYCSAYDLLLNEILPVQALVLNEESAKIFELKQPIYFFGDGMPKAKELLQHLPQVHFIENIMASAKNIIELAFEKYCAKDFTEVAYSEPNYLKEFFFTTAKK